MSTTRGEILELLANGKITAEEAARLLSEVKTETAEPPTPPSPPSVSEKPAPPETPTTPGKDPSWFKVRVRNMATGKNKVTVNIPLRMLKFGLKIGGRFSPELEGLDWDEIQGMMKDIQTGMLVEVMDEEDGEHVQVYLE